MPHLKFFERIALLISLIIGVHMVAADIGLKPVSLFNLNAKITHLSLTPGGDYLYWLNESDGKLQRLSLANRQLDEKFVGFSAGPQDYCFSPDGKIAYVIVTTSSFSPGRREIGSSGEIVSVDLRQMAVIGTMPIPLDPYQLISDGSGTLYISPGPGVEETLRAVNLRTKSLEKNSHSLPALANLRLSSDRQHLYYSGSDPFSTSIATVFLRKESLGTPYVSRQSYTSKRPLGGSFDLTPDAKFAITRSGLVLRLTPIRAPQFPPADSPAASPFSGIHPGGNTPHVPSKEYMRQAEVRLRALIIKKNQQVAQDYVEAFKEVKILEPNTAMACNLAGGHLWLALKDGRLLTYSYPKMELEKEETLSHRAESLLYDAANSLLWVAWGKEGSVIGGLAAYPLQTQSPITELTRLTSDSNEGKPASTALTRTPAGILKAKPTHTIALPGIPEHPLMSPRGDTLYWIDQIGGKLRMASLANRQLDQRVIPLPPGARDFCLSPDGRTVFVVATSNEFAAAREASMQSGEIQVLDLTTLAANTFLVPIEPCSVVCDAQGFLFITSGSGQWGQIAKVDPRQQTVLFGFEEVRAGTLLHITAGTQRLYFGKGAECKAMPAPAGIDFRQMAYSEPRNNEPFFVGSFELTPDDRFAISRSGVVLRLGVAPRADMLFAAELELNLASACDPISGRLWLSTADGRLVTYSYPDLEFVKTEKLQNPGQSLSYDAKHQTLWVAWAKKTEGSAGFDIYEIPSAVALPEKSARVQ